MWLVIIIIIITIIIIIITARAPLFFSDCKGTFATHTPSEDDV